MSRPLKLKRPPATGNPPQDNFNRAMQRKNLDIPLQAVLYCTVIKMAGDNAPRKTKKRARTAAIRYRERVLHIPKWKQEMAEKYDQYLKEN